MPIYVYGCEGCGRVEEHIQRFSDPPLTECEHCGGRLEKQVTAAAFHLKGGGWYKDGYASSKGDSGSSDTGSSSSADSGSSSSADSGSSSSSDSKPSSSSSSSSSTSSSGSSGSSSSAASS